MGMFEWNLGPSFMTGSAKPLCGIPLLLNLPADARAIPEDDSGGPMASPQWGFYGLGSRLGSNEKVELTLFASKRVGQRPLGFIYIFSPGSVQCEAVLGPSRADL